MIGIIAAHDDASLVTIIVFIALFGLFGLFMSCIQVLISCIDLKNISNYEQQVEKVLIIFVLLSSMLFVIIFCLNLTIAFEYKAPSAQDIPGIRISQLSLELIVLIAMISMIFYIYYDYIMGIADDDDEESVTDEQQEYEETDGNTPYGNDENENVDTPKYNNYHHETQETPSGAYPHTTTTPGTPGDHQAVTSDSFGRVAAAVGSTPISRRSQSRKRAESKGRRIFNDPSDDERDVPISRRSTSKKGGGGGRRTISRKNRSRSNSKNTQKQIRISVTLSKSNKNNKQPYNPDNDDNDDDGYNTGDAVEIFDGDQWCPAMVSSTTDKNKNRKNNKKIIVRILEGENTHDEIKMDLEIDFDKIRFSVNDNPMDDFIPKGHEQQRSGSIQEQMHEIYGKPPPMAQTIDRIQKEKKQKRRKLPAKPTFGAPLMEQKLVDVQDDNFEYYSQIPATLVLLKKYLFKFNGDKYVGIFVNGSIENISKSPRFTDGIISKVDLNGVKKLIEKNEISKHKFEIKRKGDEKHYAMIFAELIKLWLKSLPSPLLQNMPNTFFADITSIEFLEVESEKIQEPHLSTLMYIWDICVLISKKSNINKMNIKRLSKLFAPYLFKDKNKERNEQIKPTIINFCEIGINWRKESSNL